MTKRKNRAICLGFTILFFTAFIAALIVPLHIAYDKRLKLNSTIAAQNIWAGNYLIFDADSSSGSLYAMRDKHLNAHVMLIQESNNWIMQSNISQIQTIKYQISNGNWTIYHFTALYDNNQACIT